MRPMPELKVETVDVDELVPYAGNAKLHPDEQVEQIATSIRDYGNNDPIAVWHNADGKMEIVEGHGRVLALKKMGVKEAPVICLDHLTDNQRRAYTHIHNQLAMNTGFDTELLKEELEKLGGFDADAYGFDLGVELSSDEWEPEDYEEDDYGENDFEQQETFNCLFVYHNDEEAQKLMRILGVERLEISYEMGDLA